MLYLINRRNAVQFILLVTLAAVVAWGSSIHDIEWSALAGLVSLAVGVTYGLIWPKRSTDDNATIVVAGVWLGYGAYVTLLAVGGLVHAGALGLTPEEGHLMPLLYFMVVGGPAMYIFGWRMAFRRTPETVGKGP